MDSACADALTVLGFIRGDFPDEDQLKQRFRRLALKHHPDKAGSPESAAVATAKFQEISEAYDVLREALQEDGTLPQDAWYDGQGGLFSHGWTAADSDRGTHTSAPCKHDAYYRDCVGRWGATEFGWRAYPRAQQGPQPAHQEHPAFDYNRREYFRSTAKDADRPPPPNLFVNQDHEAPVGAPHMRPPPPDMNFRQGWGSAARKPEPPPNLDQQDEGQAPKVHKPPRTPAPEADDLLWIPTTGRPSEKIPPPDLGQEVQSKPQRIPAPPMGGYSGRSWQADPKVPLPGFQRSVLADQLMMDLEPSDDEEFFLPNLGTQVPTAYTLKVPLPNF
mmetsp:Transcript_5268/g.12683  ORF Transcript_5268/g.12683 Transcript_5268/m.12683 type:complete len:332 (+) Transcript_5268:46-1041(+)